MSTDAQSLADAEYARLTETRMERALADARRINPLAQPLLYDPVTGPCYRLMQDADRLTANRAGREQHDACARFKTKQAQDFMEDQRIERLVARQPGLAA